MSSEQIKEARDRVAAKLENTENTDDVLELTLEELTAISGGVMEGDQQSAIYDGRCRCRCYEE